MKKIHAVLFLLVIVSKTYAQGYFSGDLQLNSDFYVRDTLIKASGTPHYDNLKSSTDTWIVLNYTNDDWKLKAGTRVDLFLNSNLHNPGTVYNGYGLGFWFVQKEIKGVEITGGYFYDQFGSGITFRSYEDRSLGIDNSILGGRIKYTYKDKLVVKAFAGVQKYRFELYKPVIKGFNAEGNFQFKDKFSLIPGISFVNRTLDQTSMDQVVATIESYDTTNRFVPKYNTYAMSAYNTLNAGNFTWFIEGAYKTQEAIRGIDGSSLILKPGYTIFTTLSYSKKSFGVTTQFRRTQNFQLRTSPNESLLRGMISFMPPTARQNSLRLIARYNAASQELDESATSLDVTYSPAKGYTLNLSMSGIYDNTFKTNYFREVYLDCEFKKSKKVKALLGFQYLQYNEQFYVREGFAKQNIYSAFGELSVKINKKMSIRTELQYQNCKNDFGQWLYGLIEFNVAPNFSFSATDMWNFDPNENREDRIHKPVHYYSFLGAFTYHQHRLSLAYVRQVSGIVCTGGVCRFEPAFNGARLNFTTSF